MNSYKIDEQQVQKSNFETMPRLFRYLLKYKKRIAGVFALMAFGTAVDLVNPLLSERAIDRYIIPGNVAGLIRIVALGATINILAVLAIKLRMLLMAKTSNKVIQELRQELYDHIQSLDLAFFDSRPSGKILARIIGDSNSLKDIIENAVTTLIPCYGHCGYGHYVCKKLEAGSGSPLQSALLDWRSFPDFDYGRKALEGKTSEVFEYERLYKRRPFGH